MNASTRNYTIDLVRLVASLFVVSLHTSLGIADDDILAPIRLACRWAVPFFFLVSGYFYQIRFAKDPRKTVVTTCSRLVKLFIVASLIYWPLVYAQKGHFFELAYLWNGTHFHLWFLTSMIVGYLVLYGLSLLKIPDSGLLLVCLLVILFVLLQDSYAHLLPGFSTPSYAHRRIFLSIPFLFLGMYFRKNESVLGNYLNWKVGLALVLLGGGIQLLEMQAIHEQSGYAIVRFEFLFGTVLMAIGVFVLAITVRTANSTLSRWGEAYSLLIYLYHSLLIYLLAEVADVYQINLFAIPLIVPTLVFTLTLLLVRMIHTYLPRLFNILSGSFTVTLPNRLVTDKKA